MWVQRLGGSCLQSLFMDDKLLCSTLNFTTYWCIGSNLFQFFIDSSKFCFNDLAIRLCFRWCIWNDISCTWSLHLFFCYCTLVVHFIYDSSMDFIFTGKLSYKYNWKRKRISFASLDLCFHTFNLPIISTLDLYVASWHILWCDGGWLCSMGLRWCLDIHLKCLAR